MFKLKNSSAIAFTGDEEINNARSLVRVRITNNNILTNYFIPNPSLSLSLRERERDLIFIFFMKKK